MQFNPVATFLQESEELLAAIEQAALLLGAGEGGAETVNELFRAFHTIKGSGAMCGIDDVAGFTHHVETLLDQVREGTVAASPDLAEVVLKSADHIKLLLGVQRGGAPPLAGTGESLIEAVEQFAKSGAPGRTESPAPAAERSSPQIGGTAPKRWLISFRPEPSLLERGASPVALMRELRKLGACEVTAHTEEIPALDAIQPDLCYLWWSIALSGDCDQNAIRDVFIFVEDDCKLEITANAAAEQAPQQQQSIANCPAPLAAAPSPAPAPVAPTAPSQKGLGKESTVRVPSDRLDRLVNLVGELVMNQSRLAQAASQSGAPEFTNPVQELERLVAELRDNVLGIRMLPIGTLFGRFRRLVHDLSAGLGKEIDLVTEGAETELDKSILDQLGEPMVHLLRNSIDHGIEPGDERVSLGKPRRGTVRLSALHRGSDVVVTIEDDGRGLNRAAIRAKALERQLIGPDANLTDKEILNLILLPGFSTAREVTSVSGRGVGMDVVKRQIDALRGTLSLSTNEGKGTKLSIALPLTLAIIDGLLVQVGRDRLVIPMAAITENVELLQAQRRRNNGRNVIAVRGALVPYVDLRAAFGVEGDAPPIEKIVIVRHEDQFVGLVVDRVLGTHQTVIQSLGRFLHHVEVVSGATILGDGCVALILDIAAVVRFADGACRQGLAGPKDRLFAA